MNLEDNTYSCTCSTSSETLRSDAPVSDTTVPSAASRKLLTLSPHLVQCSSSNVSNIYASKVECGQDPIYLPSKNYMEARNKPLFGIEGRVPLYTSVKTSFPLALSGDSENLSELHCFIRRNIEVFVATKHDVEQPQPGRHTPIMSGQVGLRCIHCKSLPVKHRKKRAVCYPPNISGIYHCVKNMKFDHFSVCNRISKDFDALMSNMTRRNKLGVKYGSTSQRQYYMASAKKLGLIDTEKGIQCVTTPVNKDEALNIKNLLTLADVAASYQSSSSSSSDYLSHFDDSKLTLTKQLLDNVQPQKGIISKEKLESKFYQCTHIDYSKTVMENTSRTNQVGYGP